MMSVAADVFEDFATIFEYRLRLSGVDMYRQSWGSLLAIVGVVGLLEVAMRIPGAVGLILITFGIILYILSHLGRWSVGVGSYTRESRICVSLNFGHYNMNPSSANNSHTLLTDMRPTYLIYSHSPDNDWH